MLNVDETARQLLEGKLLLSKIAVRIDAEESCCPMCGAALTVQKTSFSGIVTNAYGTLNCWWPTQSCPNGCKDENGGTFTRRAGKLDSLAMKNHRFGYDIEVDVGIGRYMKHMQINEICEKFKAEGKKMSPSAVSRYSRQFLDHLEMLHVAHLPDIARIMAAEGGYYMQFDSTCEAGSGSLFSVLAGWRNWTLGAWRQSTENAQEMLPHVMYLIEMLGLPLAIMKDLSKQGRNVVAEIMKTYPNANIRIFACHFHLVKDIGKDILYADHIRLKGCVSNTKADLSRLVHDTRDKVTDDPVSVAKTVETWFADSESMAIAMDSDSVAIIRYLTQWVLDSSQDGDNSQFPFELPYLLFYDRAIRMCSMSQKLLLNSKVAPNSVTHKLLSRLHNTTAALASDQDAARTAALLRLKNDLFVELRAALQLEKKTIIEDACKTADKRRGFHRKAKKDFDLFVTKLRQMQDSKKTNGNLEQAVDIIIKHIDKYYNELWGHEITVIDINGNECVRVVDRTNNSCEQSFSRTKNNERRRSGRKNLNWDLTVRPAAASLVENLKDDEYLRIVCDGSLDNLPGIFANFESCPSLELKKQLNAYRECVVRVFDSGRLPRADVKVIRSEVFNTKINRIEAWCY